MPALKVMYALNLDGIFTKFFVCVLVMVIFWEYLMSQLGWFFFPQIFLGRVSKM